LLNAAPGGRIILRGDPHWALDGVTRAPASFKLTYLAALAVATIRWQWLLGAGSGQSLNRLFDVEPILVECSRTFTIRKSISECFYLDHLT
jgi:hypothetical protein